MTLLPACRREEPINPPRRRRAPVGDFCFIIESKTFITSFSSNFFFFFLPPAVVGVKEENEDEPQTRVLDGFIRSLCVCVCPGDRWDNVQKKKKRCVLDSAGPFDVKMISVFFLGGGRRERWASATSFISSFFQCRNDRNMRLLFTGVEQGVGKGIQKQSIVEQSINRHDPINKHEPAKKDGIK